MNATRPQAIKDIASREAGFDANVREFLDVWQAMMPPARMNALSEEPEHVAPVHDAYLAALAEHLALADRMAAPGWTENADRFLASPFFAGGLESLKAIELAESPLAFRRRLIFITADGLFRPPRRSVQDNALNAALDV